MIEQLQLPATSGRRVSTRAAIPAQTVATVTVSGVVGIWSGWSHGLDSAFCYDAPPGTHYYPASPPKRALHVETNYGHFDPQPEVYSAGHQYTWQFTGNGERLSLWFNDEPYDDNSGSFSVSVSW